MKSFQLIIFAFVLLRYTLLYTQGLPPVQNFSPREYHAENQNWAIAQTSDKLIYVANNKGLLEYNGANWRLYTLPDETIVRSVKISDDKIYTGSYMEFGYWKKDDFGILNYTSLSDKLAIDLLPDEEFWDILKIDNFAVFQSTKRIYVYNEEEDTASTIESISSQPKIFYVKQSIYFHQPARGIFRVENGQGVLVYDDSPVLNDEVAGIFQRGQDVLILTRHNGFYISLGNQLIKWRTNSDDILSEASVYSALQLKDQSLALGTISHGLLHIDKNGNLIHRIDKSGGLRNNTVLSLYEDVNSNIWMGLDNGISFTNLQSPYRVYHDQDGHVGSVYASLVTDGGMYLGTNQGLFFTDLASPMDFEMIPGTQGQVWSLNMIDQTLFCGHHRGTFIIRGNQAEKIASIKGTWKVAKHEGRSDLLLQGNYDGLYVLERNNDNWQLKNKINGFSHSSRFFEVYKNRIFVSHEYRGVFKVDVNSDLSTAKSISLDSTIKGFNSGLVRYGGDLLYAYKNGILKYDNTKDTFVKDTKLSLAYTEDDYVSGKMIVDKKDNYLWLFTDPNITYVSEGRLSGDPRLNSIPLPQSGRNGIDGYECISPFTEAGKYIFGNSSGYITVDLNRVTNPDFTVNLGTVTRIGRNDGNFEKIKLSTSASGELNSDENRLEITFYSAEYNKFLAPEYQYQLLGNHEEWSDWSESSFARFENLSPGDYTFKVKARIGNKVSSNTASYSFIIKRPWYQSNFMQFVFVVLTFITLLVIHSLYRTYYNKRQAKIIDDNKRELALARAQNEKEIIKIKNEQLKAEFKSKSKELAASTLSIIKKNELLNKAKEQLLASSDDKDSVKPIIHIIDKSLKQNDDWELFKEAFNNADQKFLRKLKKIHPNLSPNDIKLCAYLRLNLSSKEIAPLLNISARSVEIKRYRLRKKLGLKTDDNLVKYIIDI